MELDFAGGLRRAERLGLIAQLFSGAVMVSSLLGLIGVSLYLNDAWPDALIGTYEWHGLDIFVILDALILFMSYFAVGAWIYRAHANLLLTDAPETEFTPSWAVGWFAVPFANLFKPFQAMKALWRASHGQPVKTDETAPGLLWFWWLSWLASIASDFFSQEISSFEIVIYAATVFSAACAIVIIRKINAAQPGMSIASTFD